MKPQLKKSELATLHQKLNLYNFTKNPQTGKGDPRLLWDINRYANLIMRRHRMNPEKYQVDPTNGEIVERKAKEVIEKP